MNNKVEGMNLVRGDKGIKMNREYTNQIKYANQHFATISHQCNDNIECMRREGDGEEAVHYLLQ